MTAYIEASGCNWVLDFPAPMLDPKADNDERNFYISWMKVNSAIIGSIKLHLSNSLKGKVRDKDTTAKLITALKAEYAAPRISGAFALFKELLDMKITQSLHPAPSLKKVAMLFTCLELAGYAWTNSHHP